MIAYYLILAGEKFFPRKLPMFDALNLAGVIEPGEAIPSLDGKVYDYGRIRLSGDNLQALLQNARDILLSDGESIEDIEVNILYLYDSQCNLELSDLNRPAARTSQEQGHAPSPDNSRQDPLTHRRWPAPFRLHFLRPRAILPRGRQRLSHLLNWRLPAASPIRSP